MAGSGGRGYTAGCDSNPIFQSSAPIFRAIATNLVSINVADGKRKVAIFRGVPNAGLPFVVAEMGHSLIFRIEGEGNETVQIGGIRGQAVRGVVAENSVETVRLLRPRLSTITDVCFLPVGETTGSKVSENYVLEVSGGAYTTLAEHNHTAVSPVMAVFTATTGEAS